MGAPKGAQKKEMIKNRFFVLFPYQENPVMNDLPLSRTTKVGPFVVEEYVNGPNSFLVYVNGKLAEGSYTEVVTELEYALLEQEIG